MDRNLVWRILPSFPLQLNLESSLRQTNASFLLQIHFSSNEDVNIGCVESLPDSRISALLSHSALFSSKCTSCVAQKPKTLGYRNSNFSTSLFFVLFLLLILASRISKIPFNFLTAPPCIKIYFNNLIQMFRCFVPWRNL